MAAGIRGVCPPAYDASVALLQKRIFEGERRAARFDERSFVRSGRLLHGCLSPLHRSGLH